MSKKTLYRTFINLIWANLKEDFNIDHNLKKDILEIIITNKKKRIKKTMAISTIIKNKDTLWEISENLAREAMRRINE